MKTRRQKMTRMVEHTIAGKTRMVPDEYEVNVPVAPRDLDRAALRAVVVMTTVVVAGSVVWSTVSIGSLLSAKSPAWAAYLVAGVFDLAWITCLTVEWLSRYEPEKARIPRNAGWAALALSMGAIFTQHMVVGSPVTGVVGAAVSALAKGMWLVLMKYTSRDLLPAQQAWLDQERADINAQMAVATVQRQLLRTQDATTAQRLALEAARPVLTTVEREEDEIPETPRPVVTTPALPKIRVPSVAATRDTSGLMTTAEVATLLGVSPSTVRGWKHRGRLSPVVDDETVLYSRDAVEAFQETRR